MALLFTGALALAACVRPVPGSPTPTTAAPATLPLVLTPTAGIDPVPGTQPTPTTQPGTTPVDGVDPAQPTATGAPGETAATATIAAPVATLAATPIPATQPPPATGETTHVVVRGDNLFRIGLRYGCDYRILAQYNGIADPARIDVGQVIRIPANC
jgi:nucleoid-associated protein YgaU